MRTAVMAAALAFGPHMRVIRAPARTFGRAVMNLLDRRRNAIDRR